MITKHDVGEEILIRGEIQYIKITQDKVFYAIGIHKRAVPYEGSTHIIEFIIGEDKVADNDFVTIETYETEVNELKSIIEEKNREIERLKGRSTSTDFSHHPQENIYAKSLKNFDAEKERDKEDWRMP